MDDGNNYLRELLERNGWYKRWYTQVMADILLPHVSHLAQPEKNAVLVRFKEEENNMLALYMVKEFLKTVGLPSTAKIFETEAGLFGIDLDFSAMVQEHFSLLKPSTAQEITPPLLSQALHIWKVEAVERFHSIHNEAGEGDKEMDRRIKENSSQPNAVLDRIRGSTAASSVSGYEPNANYGPILDSPKHGNAIGGAGLATGHAGNLSPVYRHYTVNHPSNSGAAMASEPHPISGPNICRRNRSTNCKRCN